MKNITEWSEKILTEKLNINPDMAGLVSTIAVVAAMLFVGLALNWIIQGTFRWMSRHNFRLRHSKWHPFIAKRKIGHHILLLVPGMVLYFLPYLAFEKGSDMIRLLHRADIIYMLIVLVMIGNSMLLAFLDFYTTTDKSRSHPLQGLVQGLQVILYFIGGIIMVAVLIDKSPTVLLTGLGASAAVLMLIFKDSILGFVAGVQLIQNRMVRIGDWIQMPDGSANGNIIEITLNTVKVQNWDNTITMIPPYTLVSTPFKNWRGMQESDGRRVDKRIFIDMTSIRAEYEKDGASNSQIYRKAIEEYIRKHPLVAQNLDIIIAQREPTQFGLPIEVYFFISEKRWHEYEVIQSDIFDHIISMAEEYDIKLYQRP